MPWVEACILAVDENDELIDRAAEPRADYGPQQDFAAMILEHLATASVQQAHKEDRIAFAAVTPWPGEYICVSALLRVRRLECLEPTSLHERHPGCRGRAAERVWIRSTRIAVRDP